MTPDRAWFSAAFDRYWGGRPLLDGIVFKIVPRRANQLRVAAPRTDRPARREPRPLARFADGACGRAAVALRLLPVERLEGRLEPGRLDAVLRGQAGAPRTAAGSRPGPVRHLGLPAGSRVRACRAIRPRRRGPTLPSSRCRTTRWRARDSWTMRGGGSRPAEGSARRSAFPSSFTLILPAGSQEMADRSAAWMQQSLAEIGVGMKIEKIAGDVFHPKAKDSCVSGGDGLDRVRPDSGPVRSVPLDREQDRFQLRQLLGRRGGSPSRRRPHAPSIPWRAARSTTGFSSGSTISSRSRFSSSSRSRCCTIATFKGSCRRRSACFSSRPARARGTGRARARAGRRCFMRSRRGSRPRWSRSLRHDRRLRPPLLAAGRPHRRRRRRSRAAAGLPRRAPRPLPPRRAVAVPLRTLDARRCSREPRDVVHRAAAGRVDLAPAAPRHARTELARAHGDAERRGAARHSRRVEAGRPVGPRGLDHDDGALRHAGVLDRSPSSVALRDPTRLAAAVGHRDGRAPSQVDRRGLRGCDVASRASRDLPGLRRARLRVALRPRERRREHRRGWRESRPRARVVDAAVRRTTRHRAGGRAAAHARRFSHPAPRQRLAAHRADLQRTGARELALRVDSLPGPAGGARGDDAVGRRDAPRHHALRCVDRSCSIRGCDMRAERSSIAWGLALVGLVAAAAVLAPWIAPLPNHVDLGAVLSPPSAAHWLGTDGLGTRRHGATRPRRAGVAAGGIDDRVPLRAHRASDRCARRIRGGRGRRRRSPGSSKRRFAFPVW